MSEFKNYTKTYSSYLLLGGAILLIILGSVGAILGKINSVDAIEVPNSLSTTLNTTPTLTMDAKENSETQVPTDLNKPDELIEYYKKYLEQNPQSPDTPAYLSAMGNLYKMKKMDCASAIPYYERIIIEYPEWEGIKSVYPELATCYEETDNYRGKIWIYEEMMKRFPEDSQEYLFAKTSLGLQ